jgi:delta 1-pyrroline-5-carboxylate dehydrogenase
MHPQADKSQAQPIFRPPLGPGQRSTDPLSGDPIVELRLLSSSRNNPQFTSMSPSIETRLFLSGSFVEPASGSATFPVYNAYTNQLAVDVHEAGLEDINRAVEAAKEAQPAWAALSGVERAAKLEKLAQLIERDGQKIGEVSPVVGG